MGSSSSAEAKSARARSPETGLRIDLFSIFPAELDAMCELSVLGRARRSGVLDIRCWDLRLATTDAHRTIDDAPFGGGPGMILMPEPVFAAVEAVSPPRPLLLLDAGGRRFDHTMAAELAAAGGFSLLCGRYEGVDERIRTELVDGSVSIGDVVLAGGEFAAMVIVEAVGRLVPGVLGNEASSADESFATGLLEHPQWTRPASFRGLEAPGVLRSGDHARVNRWRQAMALVRTAAERPDLLAARGVSQADRELLAEFGLEIDDG
ncbi:tRNA (guanosine(37)-N1)-methyltransferase TrmD [Candidatus Poriferisodalis sp.]|uniref:tRNA (guanosine(37)-N1)-methyltransferase TrmD n=1 Tax=Candidatus Poriferisodalis sp. TaxID=3101277 RepID=UPI003B014D7C